MTSSSMPRPEGRREPRPRGGSRGLSASSKAAQPDSEQFRSSPRTFQTIWRMVPRRWGLRWRRHNKKIDTPSTRKPEDGTMLTSHGVQKRNAFAVCAAFRIEGLEASLDHAHEWAVREELDAVEHYIEEAQGYLAQIRVLHQEALDEFARAQGE